MSILIIVSIVKVIIIRVIMFQQVKTTKYWKRSWHHVCIRIKMLLLLLPITIATSNCMASTTTTWCDTSRERIKCYVLPVVAAISLSKTRATVTNSTSYYDYNNATTSRMIISTSIIPSATITLFTDDIYRIDHRSSHNYGRRYSFYRQQQRILLW